jgi:hypothetical protein
MHHAPTLRIVPGAIIDPRAGSAPIALIAELCNPLDESTWHALNALTAAPGTHYPSVPIVLRTGWLPQDPDDASPAWLSKHHAKFRDFREFAAASHPQRQWIAWPRVGDVLSDIPGIVTFLRTTHGWKVLLDPVALLTPAMHPLADEHLARILGSLAENPGVWGVLIPHEGPLAPLAHSAWQSLGWPTPLLQDHRPRTT